MPARIDVPSSAQALQVVDDDLDLAARDGNAGEVNGPVLELERIDNVASAHVELHDARCLCERHARRAIEAIEIGRVARVEGATIEELDGGGVARDRGQRATLLIASEDLRRVSSDRDVDRCRVERERGEAPALMAPQHPRTPPVQRDRKEPDAVRFARLGPAQPARVGDEAIRVLLAPGELHGLWSRAPDALGDRRGLSERRWPSDHSFVSSTE